MIFAAGLSPAWQQIIMLDALQVGEVNRAREVHWCASGKVLNVAVAAKHLGVNTTVLSTVGGLAGESIKQEIESYGINAEWIQTDEATRVCTTILELNGPTTELVENTAAVSEAVLEDFVHRFRTYAEVADVTVLTGSLPSNAPDDYYACLIRNVPAKFVLDFRGVGLMNCLPFGPFLIKPNREELEQTFGQKLSTEEALIDAMAELNRLGAEWVLVSDGSRNLYLTGQGEVWRFAPPEVSVVNPIGCGDCLSAGVAVGLSGSDAVIDAVKLGVGAATVNVCQLLPAKLHQQQAAEFAERVEVEQLR